MSVMQTLLRERWDRLTNPARLGVAAVGALLVYVALDDTAWQVARDWSAEAQQVEHLLDRANDLAAKSSRARNAILIHGELAPPRDEAEGSQSMAEAITRVMEELRITNYSFETRMGTKLPTTAFRGAVPAGRRVERVVGSVTFESSPEDAYKVIAALESSPDVDAIRALSMNWEDARRKVTTRLDAETWVIGSGSGGRRSR